jgi:hypothetical protein
MTVVTVPRRKRGGACRNPQLTLPERPQDEADGASTRTATGTYQPLLLRALSGDVTLMTFPSVTKSRRTRL